MRKILLVLVLVAVVVPLVACGGAPRYKTFDQRGERLLLKAQHDAAARHK